MPLSVLPPFLLYCFITAITPGPANLCSLSASLRGRAAAELSQRPAREPHERQGHPVLHHDAQRLCPAVHDGVAVADRRRHLSRVHGADVQPHLDLCRRQTQGAVLPPPEDRRHRHGDRPCALRGKSGRATVSPSLARKKRLFAIIECPVLRSNLGFPVGHEEVKPLRRSACRPRRRW